MEAEGQNVGGVPILKLGAESPEAYARNRLGDLWDEEPLMVLNDEGHHAYRPAPVEEAGTRWLDHGVPSPDDNTCRRILIRVAKSHVGLYCGKVVGEYIEKLVDLGHPRDRTLKMKTYIMGSFSQVTLTTLSAPVKPSDPDDEVFLLCAIDGNADYLISEDHSLTDLRASYEKPLIGKSGELAQVLGA